MHMQSNGVPGDNRSIPYTDAEPDAGRIGYSRQPAPAKPKGGFVTALVLAVSVTVAVLSADVLFSNMLFPLSDTDQDDVHVLVCENGNVINGNGTASSSFSLPFAPIAEEPVPADNVVDVQDVPVSVDYASYVAGTQQLPAPYYRSLFDAAHQAAYDQVLLAMREMRQDVTVDPIPGDDVPTIVEAVLNDNPDVFWVGSEYSFAQGDDGMAALVTLNYSMDEGMRADYQRTIDQNTDAVMAVAAGLPTSYDKLKFIYDSICVTTEYDTAVPNNQNIAGCLVDHRAACAGYARALQYLCYKCGISCAYMTGTGDDGTGPVSHAWNVVELDGIVTYVDVTWGDQVSESISDYYAYLCLTKSDIMATGHTFAVPEWAPEAEDPRYEYWVMHNGYFDVYDYPSVLSRCASGIGCGEHTTYLRFADHGMADAAYADFMMAPTGANDLVSLFPDKFDRNGESPYSAYKVDSLNVVVFMWHTIS